MSQQYKQSWWEVPLVGLFNFLVFACRFSGEPTLVLGAFITLPFSLGSALLYLLIFALHEEPPSLRPLTKEEWRAYQGYNRPV